MLYTCWYSKMVKITTRQQFEVLIQEMEANPNIARGVRAFGEAKANTDEVWSGIAEKLNSYGPPMRTTDEWQRVWIHFKAKLKKKITQHKRTLTDGGSCQEVTLSSLEQAAAEILQIGLTMNSADNIFSVLEVLEIEQPIDSKQHVETEEQQEFKQPKIDTRNIQQTPREKVRAEDRKVSLLQEQTETQTELLNTLKKIQKNICKKNEIMIEMNDLKRKKYEVLTEIKEIKKKKYEALIEEQSLDRKIKQTKLKILEKQLHNLENGSFSISNIPEIKTEL